MFEYIWKKALLRFLSLVTQQVKDPALSLPQKKKKKKKKKVTEYIDTCISQRIHHWEPIGRAET